MIIKLAVDRALMKTLTRSLKFHERCRIRAAKLILAELSNLDRDLIGENASSACAAFGVKPKE